MRLSDLLRLKQPATPARPAGLQEGVSERLPRTPRVVRWAWASAVTTGIVMALASGQSISRPEVLQLLKAVTALMEEEAPARAKDQPKVAPLDGPPIYVPDPKWGR